jgi:hypothetical protein
MAMVKVYKDLPAPHLFLNRAPGADTADAEAVLTAELEDMANLGGLGIEKKSHHRDERRQCLDDSRSLLERKRPRTGRIEHQPDGVGAGASSIQRIFDARDPAYLDPDPANRPR